MRARWMIAFVAVAAGCFSNSPAETPCVPVCRDGFTCIYGICLSRCNPPCGPGTRCEVLPGDRVTCTADLPTDAGTMARDVPTTPDVPPPPLDADKDVPALDAAVTDIPVTDIPVTDIPVTDIPVSDIPVSDIPVSDMPTVDIPVADTPAVDAPDVAARDAAVPPADAGSCGRPGDVCCGGISCFPGALCVRGRCEAYAPSSGECQASEECPPMRACVGPRSCGTGANWRWCHLCQQTTGVARYGERCNTYSDCATGVCHRGRCTFACDPGAAGDGQCATVGVRAGRCTQVIYGLTPVSDGGVPRAWQTLGACEQGCARNGDCATGTSCLPLSDELQDRVIFICGTTRATAVAGTPCMFGDDCQSGMCIGGANPMGGAACSAPCTVDGDCPPTAPVCAQIRLFTTGGTAVPTRGCLPRR